MSIRDLRLIEIELFSYCNRKCSWCPNFIIDRSTNVNQQYDINSLIGELYNNNYKGYISFSRYNEPFYDANILNETILKFKEKLPYCTYISNTNGDFLNKNILQSCELDEITIMDYDNKGFSYAISKMDILGIKFEKFESNIIYGQCNDIKVCYYTNFNLNYNISSRGGFLSQYNNVRTDICDEPKYFIGINYDGSVSPCCNVRNDIDEHKNYIIGNLNNSSLINILNSNERLEFIKNCNEGNYKKGSPCVYCNNSGGRYVRENPSIEY